MNSFDPYEQLLELITFAKAADQHIGNLLKNQQEMVKAINSQSKRLDNLQEILRRLNDEITREK
jgi:ABC-type transporter Mla subunit MlaD